MRTGITALFFLCSAVHGCSQHEQKATAPTERIVGGECEGCEAVYEYGGIVLSPVDTLPDFKEEGPKMRISGTLYERDGKTPARDVILYIYHTDQNGEYSQKGKETGWGKRHGYIRGWIKTGADGRYTFYTLKPAPYPGGGNPAHIHVVIKQPGVKEYWIDEFLFEGDPYLKEAGNLQERGGPGVVRIIKDKDGMLVARRDIILGLNVPGY